MNSLLLLKVVRNRDSFLKIRVEIVIDTLSLANSEPLPITLFVDTADRVRLGEIVKVLKVTS